MSIQKGSRIFVDHARSEALSINENWNTSTFAFWRVPCSPLAPQGVVAIASMLQYYSDGVHRTVGSYACATIRSLNLGHHWRGEETESIAGLSTVPSIGNQMTEAQIRANAVKRMISEMKDDREEFDRRLTDLYSRLTEPRRIQRRSLRQNTVRSARLEALTRREKNIRQDILQQWDKYTARSRVLDKLFTHLRDKMSSFTRLLEGAFDRSGKLHTGHEVIEAWEGLPEDWKETLPDEDKDFVRYAYLKSSKDYLEARCTLDEATRMLYSVELWTDQLEEKSKTNKENRDRVTRQTEESWAKLKPKQREMSWAAFIDGVNPPIKIEDGQ